MDTRLPCWRETAPQINLKTTKLYKDSLIWGKCCQCVYRPFKADQSPYFWNKKISWKHMCRAGFVKEVWQVMGQGKWDGFKFSVWRGTRVSLVRQLGRLEASVGLEDHGWGSTQLGSLWRLNTSSSKPRQQRCLLWWLLLLRTAAEFLFRKVLSTTRIKVRKSTSPW